MKTTLDAADPGPRAGKAALARCRAEIDTPAKRFIRRLLIPIVKYLVGFESIGEGFQWGRPLNFRRGNVRVGNFAYLGAHCSGEGPIIVGDLCMVSTHVKFVGNDHLTDAVGTPIRLAFADDTRPVTVLELDCWIGQGAIIREGIRIGRGAVVAAGAVVTKSVKPYEIVGGNPAKLIRMRYNEEQITKNDRALTSE